MTTRKKHVGICEGCGCWVYQSETWDWYLRNGQISYDGMLYHSSCSPRKDGTGPDPRETSARVRRYLADTSSPGKANS